MSVGPATPRAAGPQDVQIRVSHCGICGTDLHLFHGEMDHRVRVPHIFGHEGSGVIAGTGSGVPGWQDGDRVTVRPLSSCGACPACLAGHAHICMQLKIIGVDLPGALQEIWTVPATTLHRIPDGVSLEHAALIEPIAVACHDIRLGEVKASDFVLVQGAGPIGLLIALLAQETGADVWVSETNPFRRELASELGLTTVDPMTGTLKEPVYAHRQAGVDAVFEVTGSSAAAQAMAALLRTRGRIVVVAIQTTHVTVNLFKVFLRELRMIGARVYEPQDFEKAVQIAASGKLPLAKMITNVVDLENVGSALQEMEQCGPVMKTLVRCGD